MITIDHVSKQYGATPALTDFTLGIGTKEFFGLLGPNGAGKSTLLNILVGYLRADSGTVTIGGFNIVWQSREARRMIGFVPQEIALYDRLTPLENLSFFGAQYDLSRSDIRSRSEELLQATGLWDRRNDKVEAFSGGMKRRLNIAVGLIHGPSILLCDEPTVGVDPQSRNAIFEFLQSMHDRGTTVVYTTHYMEEAERLCTRIGIVDHGALIACGSVDELLQLAPTAPSIRVTLDDSDATLDTAPLAKLGAVVRDGATLLVTPASNSVMLSSVLAAIEHQGVHYRDVRFDRPTLESVFLHLTGRLLRD